MPELPDVELYLAALRPRLVERRVQRLRVINPFFLRTVDPPLDAVVGNTVQGLSRLGKRIVFTLDDDLHLVFHPMIAGRLQWRRAGEKIPARRGLAQLDLEDGGGLQFTEASSTKRAALHLVRGAAALAGHDPGGLEVLECDTVAFAERLRSGNHTLKRALTDPRLFSGIGNAYSDEILHAARLSPVTLTSRLDDEEIARLHEAVRSVLSTWTDRLIAQCGERFPTRVTAFRPEMAVHGKFGKPCPVCGDPVQRIVHAASEINYCATCQTGGKLLRDRALSQLLRRDWPRTLEELEERNRPRH